MTLLIVILVLLTYFFGVGPLLLFESAAHWRALPCTIVASRIRTDGRGDRTGYGADMCVFRYRIDERERASSDYQLVEDSNRSNGDAARIVRRYPPGAQATCYVDPRNPDRAVLNRSLPRVTPFGLLPLGFLIALGWGLVASERRRARARANVTDSANLLTRPVSRG